MCARACVLAPRKIEGIKEGRRRLEAFVTPHPESPNRATKLLVATGCTRYWPTSYTPADPHAFLARKTAFAYLCGGGAALTRDFHSETRFLAKFILLVRYSRLSSSSNISPLYSCLDNLGFRVQAVSLVVFNSYSCLVEKLER